MESDHTPSPEWESLFPLAVDSILAVQRRLMQVSDADVRSFVAIRREGGRANDPTTIMYGAGLATWHIEHGDFSSDQAVHMYRTGKLYGAQMALDRYKQLTGAELRADDDVAYVAAKSTVLDSYRQIDEASQWKKDFLREQRYTGANSLAVLNALLHDHTMNQFWQVYGGNIPASEALESFYTGLLDAAIFINTYAAIRDHNHMPPKFPFAYEIEDARPGVYQLAKSMLKSAVMSGVQIELEGTDGGVESVLRSGSMNQAEHEETPMFVNGVAHTIVSTPKLKQVGPNSFRFVDDVAEIRRALPVTRRQRIGRAAPGAAGGAAAANVPELWTHASPAMIAVTTLFGAALGGAVGASFKQSSGKNMETIWKAEDEPLDNPLQKK